MQEDLTKAWEKPFKCPPPIPPKPKHYQELNCKSLFNLSLFIEQNSKHELPENKTRSKKDPPPVPPKPPRKVNSRLSATFFESLSEFKSNLRSRCHLAGLENSKRCGIFITSQTSTIISPLVTSSNNIDAFTTEDRDIFSNSRSLSTDTQCQTESSESSTFDTPQVVNLNGDVEFKNEGFSEEVDKFVDELNCLDWCKECIDKSFPISNNISLSHISDAERLHTELEISLNGKDGNHLISEPAKRTKLTGSVSFTSFDNVRNSSAKEVNLKKQIFKQLFERSERKINRQDSVDNLCLGEGDFSDEESCIEPESNISNLSFLPSHQENVTKSDQTDKLYRIACELLSTEESYVKRLYLIDQVFHLRILLKNREHNMFPKEQIVQMFPNIKSIYEFHRDFLLKHLRKRIEEWEQTPKIGDIMKRFAPFLKLYTSYVQNFDNAINVIKFWSERSREFYNLLEKLQKLPECEQMSLQHHMLEPIQRVPRYLVLLREYVKCLPDDSSDKADSLDALDLVQKAASHSNESLRVCDQLQKMLSINERLGNMVNVIDPGRKFIKEGMLKRISPKDGSKTDRYLFLFHDMLLICQGVLKLKHHYKIKMKLDTSDIQLVEDSHSLQTPESFHLICKEKCLELLACNQKLREEWINALHSCITSSKFRRASAASQLSTDDLGKRAPLWTKNQETSMCMICTNNFTFFLKKRHCHACGIVVCAKCSLNKMQLEFTANKSKRVCNKCYVTLQGCTCPYPLSPDRPRKYHHSLKMKAFDNHVLCGYLKLSQDRKSWQDLYVTINDNFVLYTFKAHKDVKAHSSLPLPGFLVDYLPQEPKVFVIFHKGWSTKNYFSTDSESSTKLWINVLRILTEAEVPQGLQGCLSQKCPHRSATH